MVIGKGSNVEAGDGVMYFVVESSDVVSSEVGTDVWLVMSGVLGGGDDVAGVDVGGGMTISGGQVGLLPQKITSARCTQSEPGDRENRKVNTGKEVLYGKHNLTRESQEVMLGTILVVSDATSITCLTACRVRATGLPHQSGIKGW